MRKDSPGLTFVDSNPTKFAWKNFCQALHLNSTIIIMKFEVCAYSQKFFCNTHQNRKRLDWKSFHVYGICMVMMVFAIEYLVLLTEKAREA